MAAISRGDSAVVAEAGRGRGCRREPLAAGRILGAGAAPGPNFASSASASGKPGRSIERALQGIARGGHVSRVLVRQRKEEVSVGIRRITLDCPLENLQRARKTRVKTLNRQSTRRAQILARIVSVVQQIAAVTSIVEHQRIFDRRDRPGISVRHQHQRVAQEAPLNVQIRQLEQAFRVGRQQVPQRRVGRSLANAFEAPIRSPAAGRSHARQHGGSARIVECRPQQCGLQRERMRHVRRAPTAFAAAPYSPARASSMAASIGPDAGFETAMPKAPRSADPQSNPTPHRQSRFRRPRSGLPAAKWKSRFVSSTNRGTTDSAWLRENTGS